MKEKACQQMSFTDWFSQRLVGFTRQKKERKNHAACVLVICCLTRVIIGKIYNELKTKRSITLSDFWWRTSSCWL